MERTNQTPQKSLRVALCYETTQSAKFERQLPKYCDAAAATEAATGATTEAVYFYEKRGRF